MGLGLALGTGVGVGVSVEVGGGLAVAVTAGPAVTANVVAVDGAGVLAGAAIKAVAGALGSFTVLPVQADKAKTTPTNTIHRNILHPRYHHTSSVLPEDVMTLMLRELLAADVPTLAQVCAALGWNKPEEQ